MLIINIKFFNYEKINVVYYKTICLIQPVIDICLIFSSVGWTLLVVYGIQVTWTALPRRRSFITAGVVLLLILGCYRTFLRNNDWTSRETLLRYALYRYVKSIYISYIHLL